MSALDDFRSELNEVCKRMIANMQHGDTVEILGTKITRQHNNFYIGGKSIADDRQFKPERDLEAHLEPAAKTFGSPANALEELRKVQI